ncbi:MAG: hypothetical protein HZC38_12355 [Chloroflexi bacterium]|nr:hypothetical protein [Chloroflexota bacterium]MBI5348154.1 hypothetical protein [Chloroflexota bacterium]MBI5714195.1 hypothetical protein [Chloroflexota bacterium]
MTNEDIIGLKGNVAMQSIVLHSHSGQDGVLKLEVPLGLSNTEFEVMVIVQPVPLPKPRVLRDSALGWPPNFFESTFGSLNNDE